MENSFSLANRIRLNNPYANIDGYYGTYTSVTDACANVPLKIRKQGLTVGIVVNGGVVEHWWKDGTADNKLVPKGGAIKTDGTLKGKGTADDLLGLSDEQKTKIANIKKKQDKQDKALSTTNKTIVGAINELEFRKLDKVPAVNSEYAGGVVRAVVHTDKTSDVLVVYGATAGVERLGSELTFNQSVYNTLRLPTIEEYSALKAATWTDDSGLVWSGNGAVYWSNDEVDADNARVMNMGNGIPATLQKHVSAQVMFVKRIAFARYDYSDKMDNESVMNSQDKYFVSSEQKENISTKYLIISSNYGTVDVGRFSYPKKITIQGVQYLSNCSAVSFRYGGQVYDSDTLVGQTIPTDTEVEIFDITPLAGSEVANIRITFKEL